MWSPADLDIVCEAAPEFASMLYSEIRKLVST
jgi:hypothetical protein